MKFRFTLSHPESGLTEEITEPDGWKDAVLKLDRHEEFHSLFEYFEGSFIFYGNNGVVDGGIETIKVILRNYGIDTTLIITIDLTYDEVNFLNVFTGQLSLVDSEEIPDNKMRIPIIRDDNWQKFISRLTTPVNIQSALNLDEEPAGDAENINLRLSSQSIRYRTAASLIGTFLYGDWESADGQYLQIDWDDYSLDEIKTKYTYPISFNTELPVEKYSIDFAGEYHIRARIYFTQAAMTIGGGGTVTFDGYSPMDTSFLTYIQVELQVNGITRFVFDQTDLGSFPTDGHSVFTLDETIELRANDKISIFARIIGSTLFFPILLGSDPTGIGEQIDSYQAPPGGTVPPDFPSGLTDDNELFIEALTSFPETDVGAFLLHDVAGYIVDRTTGVDDLFYSDYFGSPETLYRQYISRGCASRYALIKGLQLRQYLLSEKPFFLSFDQFWKGANPIFNLSLSHEVVFIPTVIDVSPDINLIEDLADWENTPGATWDFATFSRPFVSVNGAGGVEGYAAGEAEFLEDQYYQLDTEIEVHETGVETPIVVVTWAILDAAFNEIETREFSYSGAGVKVESFIMHPNEDGFYFAVKITNNTPTETKNLEVLLAFTEDAQTVLTPKEVIRIERKEDQYDDSDGTSIDFYNVRNITKKYDADRIFNKVSIGYSRWQSEDIAGIDDPQSKKTYSTRFKKVGKGIDLYSEFIAASLVIEQARRTVKEKSADYKYDNETFIIAIDPLSQEFSPATSPDVYNFVPELDENFSSVTNLFESHTRYNLRLTPARNFLRWQDYLQGSLQDYLGSEFRFASGEGNYDMESVMSEGCSNESYSEVELSEQGNIPVTTDFIHRAELYEAEIPMEWTEYQTIRDNKKKPIGISITHEDPVPMFIKTLDYKPVEGKATILMWAKEYFDLSVVVDTTPMRECYTSAEECENAITDEFGNFLTDEFGVCITEGPVESIGGMILDAPLDGIL